MDDYMDSDSEMAYSPLHSSDGASTPYAKIIEQPAKCGVRFRYECEGRISGAIPGANSTTINPTYPSVKVFNYEGRAKVVVSCVTKSMPYRPHPHNLVGKKAAKDGICVMYINNEDMICSFNNLGILCAKRKDIRERLKMRELLKVDPFGTGFAHKSQAFKMIDLAVVRLCFQVYIEGPESGQFEIPLEPVVSDPIYDKKAMSELSISKLSHYSASCLGGTDIILLCDRVIKDDIQIRFFEERDEMIVWEDFGEFKAADIHKHFAISFRTPKYVDDAIQTPVSVNIQLRRPSDGGTSESLPFYMLPKTEMPSSTKRQRLAGFPYRHLRPSVKSHPMESTPLTTPLATIGEEVYVPRTALPKEYCPPQEYILPRLLSHEMVDYHQYGYADGHHDGHHHSGDALNGHELIDFDLQSIGLIEENDLSILTGNSLMAGEQSWNIDMVKEAPIDEHYRLISVASDDSVILDISANTAAVKQWSESSSKPFLCA